MAGMSRAEREKVTVETMIGMYCRAHHDGKELCAECSGLLDYAFERIDRCPHGSDKPRCDRCTTHCYKPEMRESIRTVMRYSGPRMMLHHPVMAVRHLRS